MGGYTFLAVAIVICAATGVYLIWKSRQPRDVTKPRHDRKKRRLTVRTRNLLAAGVVAGIVAWAVTGYVVTVFLLPLALIVGPGLFSNQAAQHEIDRLTAMEEWMRNLAGIMAVGSGLEQAIVATGKSIPRALETELNGLLGHIRHGMPIRQSLDKFAEELDDSTGDMLVGMLKLASMIRGSGLPAFLNNASAAVADDVRGRRQAETARAGARTEARWFSIIAVTFLTLLIVFTDFMEPYKTSGGQMILLGFFAAFVGCLFWMRQITRPPRFPRFIGTSDRRTYKGSKRLASAARAQKGTTT